MRTKINKAKTMFTGRSSGYNQTTTLGRLNGTKAKPGLDTRAAKGHKIVKKIRTNRGLFFTSYFYNFNKQF
jgi:hypothetical protein